MYDLIGDIHGYADELKALLTKLDYDERDGVWQHPNRKVIFLGDFVDRGPAQVETVTIAQRMVEAGQALAVMGNHEYNAVTWAMDDPQAPGHFLRPHTPRNRGQHQAFLEQAGEGSARYQAMLDWFKTLPLFLELPGLRVVHACWHPEQLAALRPWLDAHNRLTPAGWVATSRKDSPAWDALETLLKGLEIPLPHGVAFYDKDNNPRSRMRARWWETEHLTYRNLAMVPAEAIDSIPHEPVPAALLPGLDQGPPVFVGHYWLHGEPAPLAPNLACLDYSVAGGAEGKLCAYRFDGESTLTASHFVWVPREPHPETKK